MGGLSGNVSLEVLLVVAHAAVLVVALASAVYGIVRMVHSNREIAGERYVVGVQAWEAKANRDRKARIRQVLQEPAESGDAGETARLRLVAMALTSQRAFLFILLPQIPMQWFGTYNDPGPWRVAFTVLSTVFLAVGAVVLERDARLGTAFLRRHPSS